MSRLRKNPQSLIYIQENISSANNTYLKITPDKTEPAMFVACFFFKSKNTSLKGQDRLFELETFLEGSLCLGR